MRLNDTLSLFRRLLRPLMNRKGEIDFAGEDVAVELPPALKAEQDFAGFKTVGDLAKGFREMSGKAANLGSLETIPEDLRKDPSIAKYKNLGDLAKGHIETVKLVGRKGVIIPNENAAPEEKDAFFNSLGRPAKPEEYKFTPMDKLHPSIKITPESELWFRSVAHKHGLTQAQADAINGEYLRMMSDAMGKMDQASETQKKDAETKLRTEWGGEFDANLKMAIRVVQKFGGQDALNAFGDLGNNAVVLKALASIGKKMSEDSMAHGGISDLTATPQDAKSKIEAIRSDPKHPFNDENNPKHNEAVKEMQALYEVAYPSEGA